MQKYRGPLKDVKYFYGNENLTGIQQENEILTDEFIGNVEKLCGKENANFLRNRRQHYFLKLNRIKGIDATTLKSFYDNVVYTKSHAAFTRIKKAYLFFKVAVYATTALAIAGVITILTDPGNHKRTNFIIDSLIMPSMLFLAIAVVALFIIGMLTLNSYGKKRRVLRVINLADVAKSVPSIFWNIAGKVKDVCPRLRLQVHQLTSPDRKEVVGELLVAKTLNSDEIILAVHDRKNGETFPAKA